MNPGLFTETDSLSPRTFASKSARIGASRVPRSAGERPRRSGDTRRPAEGPPPRPKRWADAVDQLRTLQVRVRGLARPARGLTRPATSSWPTPAPPSSSSRSATSTSPPSTVELPQGGSDATGTPPDAGGAARSARPWPPSSAAQVWGRIRGVIETLTLVSAISAMLVAAGALFNGWMIAKLSGRLDRLGGAHRPREGSPGNERARPRGVALPLPRSARPAGVRPRARGRTGGR